MKLEFKDLQLLEAIDTHGSFAKAAEHLFRTRSAISQAIQKIEESIGYPIFDRTIYRPVFTKEGKSLLERGRYILKQMKQLETDIYLNQQGWESEFSISYDDLIYQNGLFSIIKDFKKVAPSVRIRLYRDVMNGCWDALSNNRATIAIGVVGDPPIELPCEQFVIGSVDFIFAISPHHPLAKIKEPLSSEEISMYCNIVISDTSQNLAKLTSGIYPGQPIIVVPDVEAKIQAQIQGLGVGYLPMHRIKIHLQEGTLVEKKVPNLKSKAFLKIAWRTDTRSKTLNWFIEHLKENHSQFLNE